MNHAHYLRTRQEVIEITNWIANLPLQELLEKVSKGFQVDSLLAARSEEQRLEMVGLIQVLIGTQASIAAIRRK